MNKTIAAITFNSINMTLSVVSDKGGFGCLEYSAKNVYSGVNRNFFRCTQRDRRIDRRSYQSLFFRLR